MFVGLGLIVGSFDCVFTTNGTCVGFGLIVGSVDIVGSLVVGLFVGLGLIVGCVGIKVVRNAGNTTGIAILIICIFYCFYLLKSCLQTKKQQKTIPLGVGNTVGSAVNVGTSVGRGLIVG